MTGRCPTAATYVSHCPHDAGVVVGRAFMVDNDPAPAVEAIRNGLKIYPVPAGRGGHGGRDASWPGRRRSAPERRARDARSSTRSSKSFNTIPPNDFAYWDLINELVQQEPAEAGDPEILGLLASVGIVKGKPFAPDARMRKILEDAVAVGNATARTLSLRAARAEGCALLPGLGVVQHAVGRRLRVPRPAAADHRRRGRAVPERRCPQAQLPHRVLLPGTGVTPAMCMRLTGIGSQYLFAITRRATATTSTVRRTYRITLPAGHPREPLLVGDALRPPDALDAPDRPARCRASAASPARSSTNADGSTDLYFGPTAPDGQGIELAADRPRQGLVPDPAPLQPAPAVLRQDLAAERDRAPRPRRRLNRGG